MFWMNELEIGSSKITVNGVSASMICQNNPFQIISIIFRAKFVL
jgi:hypothetical protein